jgi:hypothetical protein
MDRDSDAAAPREHAAARPQGFALSSCPVSLDLPSSQPVLGAPMELATALSKSKCIAGKIYLQGTKNTSIDIEASSPGRASTAPPPQAAGSIAALPGPAYMIFKTSHGQGEP